MKPKLDSKACEKVGGVSNEDDLRKAVEVITRLLLATDPFWYDQGRGYGFREAVDVAREFLERHKDKIPRVTSGNWNY